MFNYLIHGLQVSSDFDLLIDQNSEHASLHHTKINKNQELVIPENFYGKDFFLESCFNKSKVIQKDIFYAEINNTGNNVHIKQLSSKACKTDIARRIFNLVMPFVLYQKKRLVLHSSAINISGKTILFLGNSGAGKSSAASFFSESVFLSDDVVSISFRDSSPQAYPAFPYIKLTESVAKVTSFSKGIELKNDRLSRLFYKVKNFSYDSKTLNYCIFLKWDEFNNIKKLDSTEILQCVVASQIGAYPLNSCDESSKILMNSISKLSQNVDFYEITRKKEQKSFNFLRSFIDNLE